MDAHFSVIELDNIIQFSTLSRMSGFLWHTNGPTSLVISFVQYTSEIEVLACSLVTNLDYVITMLQLHPSLNH